MKWLGLSLMDDGYWRRYLHLLGAPNLVPASIPVPLAPALLSCPTLSLAYLSCFVLLDESFFLPLSSYYYL